MELKSPGLAVSAFIYWGVSPALEILYQEKAHLVAVYSVKNDEENILRTYVGLKGCLSSEKHWLLLKRTWFWFPEPTQ